MLPYRAHHPLIWSTSGKSQRSLHREYLLALCTFSDLTAKCPEITEFPNNRNKNEYKQLLKGQKPADVLEFAAIDDEQERGAAAPLALLDVAAEAPESIDAMKDFNSLDSKDPNYS